MRSVIRLLIALLGLLLASCSAPVQPLHIGTNVWPGYEPLYLARELNLLPPGDARLVEYTSATQVLEAFKDGAIEAAALTLDEALLLQQSGLETRVVLVMDTSHGADMLLDRPELDSLQALKGRRIGVEDTALGAYLLDRILTLAGLAPDEVHVVASTVYEHESLYRTGKVDAVVTFEPVASRLLQQGAHKLFDSTRIPGEIIDVLVVRADPSSHQVVQLKSVLHAWFGALDQLQRNPAEAARVMAPRLGLDAGQVQAAFDGIRIPDAAENRRLLLGSPPPLVTQAERLAQVMSAHRLANDLHPSALLDVALTEELYP